MPPPRSAPAPIQPGLPSFCPHPVTPHASPSQPSLILLPEIRNSRALSYPLLQSHIILSFATGEPQIYSPNHLRSIPEPPLFPNPYLTQWSSTPSLGHQHQLSSTAALSRWEQNSVVCLGLEHGLCEKGTWIVTHLARHRCPQPCGSLGMRVTWLTFPCRNAQPISGCSCAPQAVQELREEAALWIPAEDGKESGERQELLPRSCRQRCKQPQLCLHRTTLEQKRSQL